MTSHLHSRVHWQGYDLLGYPPYSPDLAPSDFYLFPKLKTLFLGSASHPVNKMRRPLMNISQPPRLCTDGGEAKDQRWLEV